VTFSATGLRANASASFNSPTLTYLHLDVFTDRLFGGNQLAVYLDPPRDLGDPTLQAIAQEMAFAETTFVFPPEREDTDYRVRIFTPANELPMAGHPTIGTAFALAHAGRIARGQAGTMFGEGVGPIPVDFDWEDEQVRFAWMTQPAPTFGRPLARVDTLAPALGLEPHELCPNGWPVQEVSCGTPFVIVPVASRGALDRAAADARSLARSLTEQGSPVRPVYLFTTERGADGADVYTRMFAPDIGIVEDAATGSASGPLGAYLVHHHAPEGRERVIRNRQGVRMGRPSDLFIEPVIDGDRISAVRVGGSAVIVGTGSLELR
jgi:trans-2,3-dihydro-3-hydroxyanthranilate isomerase